MEDPFRMTKVNELAKSLLEHGLASSMDEAIKQAEKLVRGETPESVKMAEPLAQEKKEEAEKAKEELKPEHIGSPSSELKPEIEDLKKRMIENEKKINLLMNKMNEIIAEINKIELSGSRLSRHNQNTNPQPSAQSRGGQSETKANLRTGGLQPGDVKIEDYFYSGSKKKE